MGVEEFKQVWLWGISNSNSNKQRFVIYPHTVSSPSSSSSSSYPHTVSSPSSSSSSYPSSPSSSSSLVVSSSLLIPNHLCDNCNESLNIHRIISADIVMPLVIPDH